MGCVIVSSNNELIARGHDCRPLTNNASSNNTNRPVSDVNALKHAALECVRQVREARANIFLLVFLERPV